MKQTINNILDSLEERLIIFCGHIAGIFLLCLIIFSAFGLIALAFSKSILLGIFIAILVCFVIWKSFLY